MTIVDLYPYLIIIGCSILAGAGWLLQQYRKQVQHNQKLIQLNEELDYDLPDFLRQCWPLLKNAGFSSLSWRLEWFGTTISEENGSTEGKVIQKSFDVHEISLVIKLYYHKRGWEQQYFNNTLAESFFLLVRMNLWIKLGSVQRAFDQTAKMTVFLQHDAKNMVQLIDLAADQLAHPVAGQEEKLLNSLRQAIPAVKARAQHMLNALGSQSPEVSPASLALENFLEQTCKAFELSVTVSGQANINIQEDRLQSILDNILGNFSRQARKPKNTTIPDIQINLQNKNNLVKVSISDTHGEPCLWPERLFEPFWSEYGTGRGIGLYQARQQVNASGGSLTAIAESNKPLCFIMFLPLSM